MNSEKRRRIIVCAALAVIIAAGLFYRIAIRKENDTLAILDSSESRAEAGSDSSGTADSEPARNSDGPVRIAVHVSGAVANPDRVYYLQAEARVQDAIETAGGATEEADLSKLNLAQHSTDGQKIYVPRQGEDIRQDAEDSEKTNVENQQKPLTNINLASKIELDALPGIGAAYAQNILDYRRDHGEFKSIEEIMKVKGIGESTFEKIKEYITVE